MNATPQTPVRISVIIPAFNEEAYLAQTLQSLAQQEFDLTYEVIVVDNNSTDSTADIARSYGVTVLHEQQPGVCAARQCGTTFARGQIVISTDADTVHPPDWLARVEAEFARASDVVLVAGPCQYENPSWWAALYPRLLFGGVSRIHARTGRLVYITATNTAFLRTVFPGYNVALTQGGDELDVLRRVRGQGRTVWLSDNVVNTSARRLRRGLLHALFVSLLAHYLFAYAVNRLMSRTLAPTAPAHRKEPTESHLRQPRALRLVSSAVITLAAAVTAHIRH